MLAAACATLVALASSVSWTASGVPIVPSAGLAKLSPWIARFAKASTCPSAGRRGEARGRLASVPATMAGLRTVLEVIAFVFPFKASLQAVSNAFTGTAPGVGLPLAHLLALALAFGLLARLALVRFAR